MKYDTIREAAEAWVDGFNAIPYSVAEKLLKVSDYGDLYEITPPSKCDRVYLYGNEHNGEHGEIVETCYDGDDNLYRIELDDGGDCVVSEDDFEVEREGGLPMWGTLWAFGENIDNAWLDGKYIGNGLQAMADCGFRIYESEDYEYIFGIDGAGYDFYEAHWIPLYKARGLHWHKEESEEVLA